MIHRIKATFLCLDGATGSRRSNLLQIHPGGVGDILLFLRNECFPVRLLEGLSSLKYPPFDSHCSTSSYGGESCFAREASSGQQWSLDIFGDLKNLCGVIRGVFNYQISIF